MKNFMKASLLFLTLTASSLYAQNYSPIVDGNTSLFKDNGTGIQALHVDSTTSDLKGTAYHFLKTWQYPMTSECLSYDAPTWAGPKCVKNGNTYYFFNKDLDTIYLSPLKEVNANWTFFKYDTGDYIEATITAKEQKTFFGLTDSVKTVSLHAKDMNGNSITNIVNGVSFQLSKHYGFVQTLAFLNFPDINSVVDLVGLTVPKVGIQLIRSNDIFDYEVGDVFHYDEAQSNPPSGSGIFIKKIYTVMDKRISTNADTVIYQIQRVIDTAIIDWQTHVERHVYSYTDIITEKHVLNEPIYYPEQAILALDYTLFIEKNPYHLYSLAQSNTYNNRPVLSHAYDIGGDGECWVAIIFSGYPVSSYAKGLGLVEYDYHTGGVSQNYVRLVYFKKGSETWGTALTLSNYSRLKDASTSLFPNPLKQGEQLNIETKEFQTKQVIVFNSIGTRVKDILHEASTVQSINLSDLQSGIYIVQLINEKNEFITSKLIIK